jgi:tripartite-type tricarboxylate transporter receptor subunit TctC
MKEKLYAFVTAFIMSFAMIDYSMAAKQIEIIVPTPAGGAIDTTARAISKVLTTKGIDNVVGYYPGAAGEIAFNRVVKEKNNVIFIASSANFVFFDVANKRDKQIVDQVQIFGPSVVNSMMFVVGSNTQFKSFKELIQHAKKHDLPCGVSNSHGEINLLSINKQYGTKFTPVLYKGTGQMMPNVIGGQLSCAFDQTAPYSNVGDKVVWLATSGPKVLKPGVPTISSELPKFKFETWYAAAIPNESNLLENSDVIETLKFWTADRDAVKPLLDTGFEISPTTIDLTRRAANETDSYRVLLKK